MDDADQPLERKHQVHQDATWMDTPGRYGTLSRSLHWIMAALILWQFLTVVSRLIAEDTPVEAFLFSTHVSVGFTIFVLAIARGAWGLANYGNRPRHDGLRFGRAADAGHLALYVLMIATPALAMLRSYGGGRGLRAFGVPILPATGERTAELTAPASLLHGPLGYCLFALVAGHLLAVVLHERVFREPVLDRMR
jgi:cytochrome b561